MSKHFYMLCGVPGSGKTTWIAQFKYSNITGKDKPNIIRVLSTDDIIESIQRLHDLTYNEVFDNITYAFAEKMMHKLAKYAFERADIVIWDQTNISKKTRAKKLQLVPEGWQKIAVVFKTPDLQELTRRHNNRPGKVIPKQVMDSMIKNYVEPSIEEGFDNILRII